MHGRLDSKFKLDGIFNDNDLWVQIIAGSCTCDDGDVSGVLLRANVDGRISDGLTTE